MREQAIKKDSYHTCENSPNWIDQDILRSLCSLVGRFERILTHTHTHTHNNEKRETKIKPWKKQFSCISEPNWKKDR